MEEVYVLGSVYMFDSAVIQVGLFLVAFFVAMKVAIRLVSMIKSFLWPFPPLPWS